MILTLHYSVAEAVSLPVGTVAVSGRGTKTIRLTPAQMVCISFNAKN